MILSCTNLLGGSHLTLRGATQHLGKDLLTCLEKQLLESQELKLHIKETKTDLFKTSTSADRKAPEHVSLPFP